MALVIRMRQQGRKNRHSFRIVVTENKNPRDGKYLESLGSYDPHQVNSLQVNGERLAFWVEKGAQITESVEHLVKAAVPAAFQKIKDEKNGIRVKRAAKRRALKKKKMLRKNEI